MLRQGYLRVARPAGIELRLHWTLVLGAVLAGRFRLAPSAWLGFAIVVLVHQLGHALFALRVGGLLAGIDTTAVGGQCRVRGWLSPLARAWVAWGGPFAQLLLLGAALGFFHWHGAPSSTLGSALRSAFVDVNLALLALNLLPIAPLDGALAWELFGELRASGWSFRTAVFSRVWRWAHGGRERWLGDLDGTPELLDGGPEPAALPSPRSSGASQRLELERRAGAGVDPDSDEVTLWPQPSAEAQREIDALLARVYEAAERARRGG
jgi:hypothetical protein